MKLFSLILVLTAVLLWQVPEVSCEENSKKEVSIYAVQNRIFHRDHEINFNLDYITNEDFYNSIPVGFGYVYNL